MTTRDTRKIQVAELMPAHECTHCRTRSASWLLPWRRGCSACLAFAGPRHPEPGLGPASPNQLWPSPNWRPAARRRRRRSAISRHLHSVQSFPSSALQQKKKFDTGQNRDGIYIRRQSGRLEADCLARWFSHPLANFHNSDDKSALREKSHRIVRK